MRLRRISDGADGTFGVLLADGLPVAVTLELPWRENRAHVSCIPEGEYALAPVVSPRHGETFEVWGVPGRAAILIHTGNSIMDTEGCILVGSGFGEAPDGTWGVRGSREALGRVKALLRGAAGERLVVEGIENGKPMASLPMDDGKFPSLEKRGEGRFKENGS
jgi:hypothetical protein